MFSKTALSIICLAAAATAQTAIDYSKQVGATDDGRFRPSPVKEGWKRVHLMPTHPSSHASNLLALKNGDLLCVWFSGTWKAIPMSGIVMARLPKGSKQWDKTAAHRPSRRRVLSESGVVSSTRWRALAHPHHARGWRRPGQCQGLVMKSSDGGKTWTTPAVLFEQPGAFVRQPLLVMPNGDWMLPMYFTPSRGITTGAETNYSVVKISSDRGAHRKDCAIPESNGYVQPNVVRLSGKYVAFFRSRFADYIYKSTSSDGCTWAPPQKTELPNNNSSIQATKLANGHLVMAFNDVGSVVTKGKPQAGPRKPLSVALSEDGGETWGWVRDLETGVPRAGELPPDPGTRKSRDARNTHIPPSPKPPTAASTWPIPIAATLSRQSGSRRAGSRPEPPSERLKAILRSSFACRAVYPLFRMNSIVWAIPSS